MTFTANLRAEYERVCEYCGFKVNRERLEASKTGLDLMQYKLNQEKEKSAAMEGKLAVLTQALDDKTQQINTKDAVIASKSQKLDELEEIYTRTYNNANLAAEMLKKHSEKEI